jgi:hypothetical protein
MGLLGSGIYPVQGLKPPVTISFVPKALLISRIF